MSGTPPGWLLPEAPVDLGSREGRVKALGELAEALLAGKKLPKAAAMFLGSAISAWLAKGGSLERDYLEVTARAGSHRTPAWLWSSSRGQQDFDDSNTVEPLEPEGTKE